MRYILKRPLLRGLYWFVRSPFSSYAAYCWYKERLAWSLRTNGKHSVIYGPFAGMLYTRHGSSISLPILLGSYELEIWPFLDDLEASKYDRVVDVGSAEGYFACGLARRLQIPVVACDVDESARKDCQEMVELNGLEDLVEIHGSLTDSELQSLCVSSNTLLFCDIEGAEADLLDPTLVPSLTKTDMLVEIHGSISSNTFPVLESRFRDTHDLQIAEKQPRFPEVMEATIEGSLELDEPMLLAFTETRGFNEWVFFRARSR